MTPERAEIRPRVVVVCVHSSEPRVRETITYNCPDWETSGDIAVVAIPPQWRRVTPEVSRRLEAIAPKSAGLVQVVMLDSLESATPIGQEEDDLRRVTRIPALDGFVKKFPTVLQGVGLDWLTTVERKLYKWRHGTQSVDKARINLWLKQFDQLGSHRWIGEALLKVFDFWPENRLLASVALTAETLSVFDRVCFHQRQSGKSADVLANLFAKQIRPLNPNFPDIADLYAVLSDGTAQTGRHILFIEDGLFSGTEMSKLLSDLLGLEGPPGRRQKIPKLEDLSVLQRTRITLLFPVATSFGVARLESFLAANGLSNIDISPCSQFEVLTTAGQQAWTDKKFFDSTIRNSCVNPDEYFIRVPFQNMAVWKSSEKSLYGMSFCSRVGYQLFRQYLKRRGHEWPDLKIQRCGLGMYGMGLAFAFAHSVPKATLPLFWAAGPVDYDGKTINWVPLFPDAE
jgi:hypothetical protein